jgi:hypothetical protein
VVRLLCFCSVWHASHSGNWSWLSHRLSFLNDRKLWRRFHVFLVEICFRVSLGLKSYLAGHTCLTCPLHSAWEARRVVTAVRYSGHLCARSSRSLFIPFLTFLQYMRLCLIEEFVPLTCLDRVFACYNGDERR